MHKVINNPDINEFDLNEALGVFFNRNLLETFSIWECRNDKWMREKSKNVRYCREFCLFGVFVIIQFYVFCHQTSCYFHIMLNTTRNQLYFFLRALWRGKHKQLDDVKNICCDNEIILCTIIIIIVVQKIIIFIKYILQC